MRELERGVALRLPILPLRIENVTPGSAMEFYISSCHWLDALTPPLEQHLLHLADNIKLLLSQPNNSPIREPVRSINPVSPIPAESPYLKQVMKYYVYVSKTKVSMLYSQIEESGREREASSGSSITRGIPENTFIQLQKVLRNLNACEQVGTVACPRPYIYGVLPMKWVTWDNEPWKKNSSDNILGPH